MNNPNYENEIYEIEQLLDLVEKVDKRIHELDHLLFTQNKKLLPLVLGLVVLPICLLWLINTERLSEGLSNAPLLWLSSIIVVGLSYCWVLLFVFTQFKLREDNKKQLQVENRIMGDLVQMLPSLVERIKPHIGIVTHATMEMRLRRIRFSPSPMLPKTSPTKVRNAPAEGEIAVNEI